MPTRANRPGKISRSPPARLRLGPWALELIGPAPTPLTAPRPLAGKPTGRATLALVRERQPALVAGEIPVAAADHLLLARSASGRHYRLASPRRLSPARFTAALRALALDLYRRHQGLALHAAAVVRAGQALVLAGRAGHGKSTAARCFPPPRVIADETVFLRQVRRRFVADALPFGPGRAGGPRPVQALLLLAPDRRVFLERLTPAVALAGMLSPPAGFEEEIFAPGGWFDRAADLAAAVPCWRLHFRRDCGWQKLLGQL